MNSKWYLVRLFRQSKFLFVLVIIVFALHINANFFFGGQQAPFFHWSLYAAPIPASGEYSFYEVKYNGNKLLKIKHTWELSGVLLMMDPLVNYLYMYQHKSGAADDYIRNWNSSHPSMGNLFPGLKFFPDSAEMKQFPDWFARKLEQYSGEPIRDIQVSVTTVTFRKDGSVQYFSTVPLCKLK